MTRSLLLLSWISICAVVFSACVDDLPLSQLLDGGADFEVDPIAPPPAPPAALPPGCTPIGNPLPKTLSCTGLYGDVGASAPEKPVHPGNREFAPGRELWTDGAAKLRWIALPEGSQIDTSNPNGWVFPDGTRVWKEFKFDGKRAETRFMYKESGIWSFTTYLWNETDTEAVAIEGGAEVPLMRGGAHDVPTREQCNQCHRGSRDKLLGFQQVLLGLPEAKGLNLPALVAENRLSAPPSRTTYVIPDDGTGLAAQSLSWLHVNCGVSCHNETGNAEANMSKMFLRIDPATLDDPSPAQWNIIRLTVGVPSMTPNFFGGVRIVPGSPDDSVLIKLAETRGSNEAMPPIGTRIVDPNGLALLREWIKRLAGPSPAVDAGVAMDAGVSIDGAVALDAEVPPTESASDAASADAEVAN